MLAQRLRSEETDALDVAKSDNLKGDVWIIS